MGAGAIWGLTVLGLALLGQPEVSPPKAGLLFPIAGKSDPALARSFEETRGDRPHAALDIAAERGAAVRAVASGRIVRMTSEGQGGIALEQVGAEGTYCFYYAHLEGYAEGIAEGIDVSQGELLGSVGTSGNAPQSAPHLHFAVRQLEPGQPCWDGTPVDPYPFFADETAAR